MKKMTKRSCLSRSLRFAVTLALLIALAMLAACGPHEENPDVGKRTPKTTEGDVCIGIEITKMPTKTEYIYGEKFNPSGLLFNAIYQNGYDGDKGFNASDLDGWSPKTPLTDAVTEVILVFEGFEKAIPISVVAKELKGIEITREPDIKAYSVGDPLDLTGLTVKAEYEEGTVNNETGYIISDKDGRQYAQDTVLDKAVKDLDLTVTLTVGKITKTDVFTVHVDTLIKVQAEDLVAAGGNRPTDKSYTVVTGRSIKDVFKTDCTFTGTGYLGNITKGVQIDFFIYSAEAMKNVELVLIASSTRLDNVNAKMMDCRFNKLYRVFTGEDGEREEVFIGDDVIIKGKPFPPAGSGGNKWTNWADVSFGNIELKRGFNKVSVQSIGSEKDADLSSDRTPNIDRLDVRLSENPDAPVRGDVCTDIVINAQPAKLVYEAGESFSADGIIFDAVYQNGYAGDKNLKADRLTWEPEGALSSADTSVTLIYKGFRKSISITVNQKILASVEITSMPVTTVYTRGAVFSTAGLVVKAVYNEGDNPDVKNYIITDADDNVYTNGTVLNTAGEITLTVSLTIDGVTKSDTFKITVLEDITVQAEAVLAEGEETPADRSYTVISGPKVTKIETGNGAKCVSELGIGNVLDFYIYSKTAAAGVDLILTAAALDRGANMTHDVKFNSLFSIAVDDEVKVIGEDVVIAGRSVGAGERIWFLWTDNFITKVDLNAGYTKISLTCTAKIRDRGDGSLRSANIDKIQIKF